MKKITVYQMTTCAIMAALFCVLGPISIPIGPIPVSLQIFLLLITVILLGTKLSLVSYLVYLLLGLFGLPVFSGFSGGVAKIAGPTGGYLIGFIPTLLVAGWVYKRYSDKKAACFIGFAVATLVAYFFGTVWFVLEMKCTVWYALTACVFPFIPFDVIKIILAMAIGGVIRRQLAKADLLPR